MAMVLADGQGGSLGALTSECGKPAILFGAQYRIIDFVLSNCSNSGLDTAGILTQYQPLTLHAYIGNGSVWELDRQGGGVHILPPYTGAAGGWYSGTADAVYKNSEFIDGFAPQYVVILSGGHIYKMDYSLLLEQHKRQKADVTLAKSNQTAMGVYLFTWSVLKHYLLQDAAQPGSGHDLAKNIIPAMLAGRQRVHTYQFTGYWNEVETLDGYWQANMDLLGELPKIKLADAAWPVYSSCRNLPPHYHGSQAGVHNSLVAGGVTLLGVVNNSVVFPGVYIGEGVRVSNSVVLPYARLEQQVSVDQAIVTAQAVIRGAGDSSSGLLPVMAQPDTAGRPAALAV